MYWKLYIITRFGRYARYVSRYVSRYYEKVKFFERYTRYTYI